MQFTQNPLAYISLEVEREMLLSLQNCSTSQLFDLQPMIFIGNYFAHAVLSQLHLPSPVNSERS